MAPGNQKTWALGPPGDRDQLGRVASAKTLVLTSSGTCDPHVESIHVHISYHIISICISIYIYIYMYIYLSIYLYI